MGNIYGRFGLVSAAVAAGPTILYQQNFNGFAEGATPTGWTGGIVTADKWLRASGFSQQYYSAQTWTDIRVEHKLRYTLGAPGDTETWRGGLLALRKTSGDNMYLIDYNFGNNAVQIIRQDAGANAFMAGQAFDWVESTEYALKVEITGAGAATNIKVYIDNVMIIDHTDTGNVDRNSGTIGVRDNGLLADFDDLVVTQL